MGMYYLDTYIIVYTWICINWTPITLYTHGYVLFGYLYHCIHMGMYYMDTYNIVYTWVCTIWIPISLYTHGYVLIGHL